MNSRLSLLAMAGTLALAGGTDNPLTPYPTRVDGSNARRSFPGIAELCPLDSHVEALGKGNAVVRYTYDPEGADMCPPSSRPSGSGQDGAWFLDRQFVTYLTPGETAEVSATGGVDSNQDALELAYDGGVPSVQFVRPRWRIDQPSARRCAWLAGLFLSHAERASHARFGFRLAPNPISFSS